MTAELQQRLQSAAEAMRSGRHRMAQEHWERALRLAPEHPMALNGLGTLALAEDQPARAATFFKRAAERDAKAAVLWLNHARAARAAGDEAGERESLMRAVTLEPLSLLPHVRLAEQAERTGDTAKALEHWKQAVAIAAAMPEIPPDARAAVERGRTLVTAQTQVLSDRIDAALASKRAGLAPAERRRVDAAIDHMFGRRSLYINQCSGLHVPFLPADEYFDEALFPWFDTLDAATDTIRAELLPALQGGSEGFEPYVQLPPGTPRNLWSELDGSADWNTLHLWRHGKRHDEACARFPRTAALLDTLPLAFLPGRMPTVFFSVLAPHAHIPPHTGVTNARAIVHLPLIVPPGCRFRVGGETRPWIEGKAFAFDDTIEHEAWNDSDHPRVILILDTWNPHLKEAERDLLVDFYAADSSPPPAA